MSAKLSTHVLDTKNGKPAAGVKIDLFEVTASGDLHILSTETNSDGRTDELLLSGEQMRTGDFKLLFHIGDYFYDSADKASFLTVVPVQFRIDDASAAYHVPLLASPWSYSVYRGS